MKAEPFRVCAHKIMAGNFRLLPKPSSLIPFDFMNFAAYRFLFFMNEKKAFKGQILFLFIIIFNTAIASANKSEIIVDCTRTREINSYIFGQNTLAFRYTTSKNNKPKDYSIYGAGQWDASNHSPNNHFLQLARKINTSILRFPGGGGTHRYKWKNTIGPLSERPSFIFGLDEFMKLCEAMGAEPIITMNYMTSTDSELEDMVEYLNGSAIKSIQSGASFYGSLRASNGRLLPYNIKYFELGNEVYYPDIRPEGKVTTKEYAHRYLKVRSSLRDIDKNIQLGCVLYTPFWHWTNWNNEVWNIEVVSLIGKSLDFAIVHPYACSYISEIGELSALELFRISLAAPPQIASRLAFYSNNIKNITGKSVPLAITEYNGGMVQAKPVPYRHSLGNALVIADMVKEFLTADFPILCANYWHFSNAYWGAIYSADYKDSNASYFLRPNYFVFKMFAKFYNGLLANSAVICPKYTSRSYRDVSKASTPFLSAVASLNKKTNELFLIVINKNLTDHMPAIVKVKNFNLYPKVKVQTLNGDTLDATNEDGNSHVTFFYSSFNVPLGSNQLEYNFEPHSVTLLTIKIDI